jgi:hypothetical protein
MMTEIQYNLIPIEEFDHSLIKINQSNIFIASPQEIPRNFPVTIVVDGKDASSIIFSDIRPAKAKSDIKIPEINKMSIPLANGLQAINLPITEKDFSFPCGDYFIDLIVTGNDSLQNKKETMTLPITVLDHEILRNGQILFLEESRIFVVAVTPAMALLYSKDTKKCLVWLGFPEVIISSCLCGDNLILLSKTGLLHCYSLQNFSRKSFRLIDKRQKTGTIQAISGDSFVWYLPNGKTYYFVYTRGNLNLTTTKKPEELPGKEEVILHVNDEIQLAFNKGSDHFFIDRQGDREEVNLISGLGVEGVPSLLLAVPGNDNRNAALWIKMKQKVTLYVYEWNDNSLKEIKHVTDLPSYGIRCNGNYFFYAHQTIFGASEIRPFTNKLRGVSVPAKHEQEIRFDYYCSALRTKNLLYAVGDNAGFLHILKPGAQLLRIQAHNAANSKNLYDNTTVESNFVSALCWTDSGHLLSAGIDTTLKCHSISFKNNSLSSNLIWEKKLFDGAQSLTMADGQILVSTTEELLWIDPDDGMVISRWSSSGAVLDTVIYTGTGKVVVADWDGNIHFFKNGKKIRSSKICNASILAMVEISQQYLFITNENHKGLLIDMENGDTVVGRCNYRLFFGQRNALDVFCKGSIPSLLIYERLANIVSHAPVFSYPWRSASVDKEVIHFSPILKGLHTLQPLITEDV